MFQLRKKTLPIVLPSMVEKENVLGHPRTLCGQNVELLNVKSGGTYSDHWAVKG